MIETCKCGCFVFDAEAKKCAKCGDERENNPQDNVPQSGESVDRINYTHLLTLKYITLYMPHFNQNVRLKIECRSVFDSNTPCIRLHGRVDKKVIVSEPIFSQKDINEMAHIFQPIKS